MAEGDSPAADPSVSVLRVESAQRPLVVRHHARYVDSFTIFEQELDDLAAGNAPAFLGLTCAAAGIAVTLLVTLATVPLDPRAFGAAAGALIAALLATTGFGVAAWRDRQRARRSVERIKTRHTPG